MVKLRHFSEEQRLHIYTCLNLSACQRFWQFKPPTEECVDISFNETADVAPAYFGFNERLVDIAPVD